VSEQQGILSFGVSLFVFRQNPSRFPNSYRVSRNPGKPGSEKLDFLKSRIFGLIF